MGKKVWDPVSRHINASRTHYLKWDLTKDISVRYHFLHQGNRELEGQFIIKIHSNGSYQLVDRDFAKKMILSYKRELNAPNTEDALVEPDYEISGRLMRCPLTNRIEFHKTIIEMRTMVTHFGIDVNTCLKTISYNQDGDLCFKENLIMEVDQNEMSDDLRDEKLREAHGLYFSGPRKGTTTVFVTDSLSAENKAAFMYPNMEVNKRFVGEFIIEDGARCKTLEEQKDNISLDANTEDAIKFAIDKISQVPNAKTQEIEMPDDQSNIKPETHAHYFSIEKTEMTLEDPNDIKLKVNRNGEPLKN